MTAFAAKCPNDSSTRHQIASTIDVTAARTVLFCGSCGEAHALADSLTSGSESVGETVQGNTESTPLTPLAHLGFDGTAGETRSAAVTVAMQDLQKKVRDLESYRLVSSNGPTTPGAMVRRLEVLMVIADAINKADQ